MGRNHEAWGGGTRIPQVIKILKRQRGDSCRFCATEFACAPGLRKSIKGQLCTVPALPSRRFSTSAHQSQDAVPPQVILSQIVVENLLDRPESPPRSGDSSHLGFLDPNIAQIEGLAGFDREFFANWPDAFVTDVQNLIRRARDQHWKYHTALASATGPSV
jgi:hypothetical protein